MHLLLASQLSENNPFNNSGSLEQENPGENDYTLKEGQISCWITVDNLSVYVVRTDEGVVVDIFPRWREEDESLASCYAFNAEVATEDERAAGMSTEPCKHEPHTPGGGGPTYCWKCRVTL